MLSPMLPYLALQMTEHPGLVTLLTASYAAAAVIFAPIVGRLSDHHGRRLALLLTLSMGLFAYLGMLAANSLALLLLFRALGGVSSANDGLVVTMLTDDLEAKEHVTVVARLGAVRNAGTILGPLLTTGLALIFVGEALYNTAMAICAGLAGLAIVVAAVAFRKHRRPACATVAANGAPPVGGMVALQGVAPQLMGALLLGCSTGVMFGITALVIAERFGWGAKENGLLLSACLIGVIASRLMLVPAVGGRFGLERAFLGAVTLAAAGFLLAAVARSSPSFVAGVLVAAVATSGALIFNSASLSARAAAGHRGLCFGWNTAMISAGVAAGAMVSGLALQLVGDAAPFMSAAVLLALLPLCHAVAAVRLRVRSRPSAPT